MTHWWRLFSINRTLVKYRLDEFLEHTPLARYRWLLRLLAGTITQSNAEQGERLRLALTELGPIFIKFGQMLSTRRDLLPLDIAQQLAQLQDQVPPFQSTQAIALIEQQLKKPISELFAEFESHSMASASVAQVHAATLHSGEKVVVKVIRPGIEHLIKQDLQLMHQLAAWFDRWVPDAKRFKAKQVVKDYQESIYLELDLRTEAANTMQLRRNFENSELLYVPKVYWEMTEQKVMVQERISGIPIADIEALNDAGVNMQRLAHRGVEIFFTQVFEDSFFHADMHPGNIFVDSSDPEAPRYIGIDCGIMGTLGAEDKRYLAENFLAFFEQDYRRIAELHVQSGWVAENTSIEAFESAIRTACEPIFGKPIAEISFGQFLVQLFQVARRFQMEVQPQLVLLQKTLLYVEGLGRQLYPQLDLWETAQPFLKRWLAEQLSPKRVLRTVLHKLPHWAEQLPEMPDKIAHFLEQHHQTDGQHRQMLEAVNRLAERQARMHRGIVWAIVGGSALFGAAVLYPLQYLDESLVLLTAGLGCCLLALRR